MDKKIRALVGGTPATRQKGRPHPPLNIFVLAYRLLNIETIADIDQQIKQP